MYFTSQDGINQLFLSPADTSPLMHKPECLHSRGQTLHFPDGIRLVILDPDISLLTWRAFLSNWIPTMISSLFPA